MKNFITARQILCILSGCLLSVGVFAVPTPTDQDKILSHQQLIHQQERQKVLEESLKAQTPDIRLLPAIPKTQIIPFPQESLCFPIKQVELLERDLLPHTLPLYSLARQAEGRCLGGEGINILMIALQNRIISYGYITTRVVAPPQDLTTGTLSLLLIKGTVRHLYYADESDTYAYLKSAMPVKVGDILNLRDIEQGLENLQRSPSAKAKMQLVPGDNPGESDIAITRNQSKYWRLGASLDDSGTKNTGRYQGGLTFYLDNPLALNDTFYVSGGHDIERKSQYGSKNHLFSYSLPLGYWLFNTSFNNSTCRQTVAGTPDYEYSGRSHQTNLQISRVIHRNESQKTTLSYGIHLKESRNYIGDTEIGIQHRKTTHWRLGATHRHYFDDITLDIGTSYQRGVRWFGAHVAPEEYVGEGSALSEIFNLNVALAVPFTVAKHPFRYRFDYQGQLARGEELTPPDRFSIGSRWTVRGFDGELTLSADNGWYVKNELAWITPYHHEFYLGLDAGEVSGADSGHLLGKRLVGSILGIKGQQFGFYYDLFAGKPIHKPDGFKNHHITLGFNLNWMY